MADSREWGFTRSSRSIQAERAGDRNGYKSFAVSRYSCKDVCGYRRAGSRIFGTNLAADYGRNEGLDEGSSRRVGAARHAIGIEESSSWIRECSTCQDDRTGNRYAPIL